MKSVLWGTAAGYLLFKLLPRVNGVIGVPAIPASVIWVPCTMLPCLKWVGPTQWLSTAPLNKCPWLNTKYACCYICCSRCCTCRMALRRHLPCVQIYNMSRRVRSQVLSEKYNSKTLCGYLWPPGVSATSKSGRDEPSLVLFWRILLLGQGWASKCKLWFPEWLLHLSGHLTSFWK